MHGEVGPRQATISAIADRAGVTRATIYRHFPDEESLFLACSAQWLARQHLPDPSNWREVEDPQARLRRGLADIYRYYRDGAQMLDVMIRDADAVPDRVRGARLERELGWQHELLKDFPGGRRARVRAGVAHAIAFGTWRSLCVDLGLPDGAAADLMVGMVGAAAVTAPP